MQKILVSACLLGMKVRYDGGDCEQNNVLLHNWLKLGKIVTICPEMAGGLPAPRPPAEIIDSKVITNLGIDVTAEFNKGAQLALELCQKHQIKFALLKSRSPSCGNQQIYDGTFTRTLLDGQGITAKLLTQNGIKVFNETQIDKLIEVFETYDE